jgi:histidine ammonia-lyase
MASQPPVLLGEVDLTIEDVVAVARDGRRVRLAEVARQRMGHSRDWVDQAVRAGEQVYGVNTGFGPLARKRIAIDETRALSRNVIAACIAGVGPPLADDLVRAMLLVRANTLAAGLSGVRPVVVETLCSMLERGVTPVVPGKGSLGASGDLAPLAHIAAVGAELDGLGGVGFSGHARVAGEVVPGAEAMARAGVPRLELEAKEGLALTNGTTLMVAAAALAVADARSLVAHAEIAAALTFEALLALSGSLDPTLHEVSRQPGQIETAAQLRALLAGSVLVDSDPDRVQDAYSLRCTPQVIGPVRDVVAFLGERVGSALNGVADNPLIVDAEGSGGRALSGGNFHGQGLALWLDMLAIAVSELASIAERRTFRLLTPELSGGLPSMLAPDSGLDSGLMMAQYTAAALVSDNKTLAHPDSVDSIPSSANQEDHVSMGANAARHALEVLDNVRAVIAIELLLACQAIDLRPDGVARLGRGTAAAYRAVRREVGFLVHDRAVSPDIERLDALIRSGSLLAAVGDAISP